MAGIPFLCLAFLDLLMGSLITAPLAFITESLILKPPLFPYTISGTLHRVGLPEPLILLVIGLLWTLVLAFSDNIGLAWNCLCRASAIFLDLNKYCRRTHTVVSGGEIQNLLWLGAGRRGDD